MSKPSQPHSTRGLNSGFTLVELLVVIGIIAVLIGMLLPTLNKAQAAGKSVSCMSNLRQLATAMVQYTAANKGRLPGLTIDAVNAADPTKKDTLYWLASKDGSTGNLDPKGGYLYPYLKTIQVNECPATPDLLPDPDPLFANLPPYSYTLFTPTGATLSTQKRITNLKIPAETVMFCDGAQFVGTVYGRSYSMSKPSITGHLPRFQGRHSRDIGNVAWYDGHVTSEPVNYQFSKLNRGLTADVVRAAKLGFLIKKPFTLNDAMQDYYYWCDKSLGNVAGN